MRSMKIFVLGLMCVLSFSFIPKEKLPFDGYKAIKECQIELPVSYSTSKLGPFVAKAKELENVKIAMVTLVKNKNPKIEYYYLEITEAIDGENAVFVSSENHENGNSEKSHIYMGYKKNKQFFYTADCLNEKLESNTELKGKFEVK